MLPRPERGIPVVDERDHLVAHVVEVAPGARRVQELRAAAGGPRVDEHDHGRRRVAPVEHRVEALDHRQAIPVRLEPLLDPAAEALQEIDGGQPQPGIAIQFGRAVDVQRSHGRVVQRVLGERVRAHHEQVQRSDQRRTVPRWRDLPSDLVQTHDPARPGTIASPTGFVPIGTGMPDRRGALLLEEPAGADTERVDLVALAGGNPTNGAHVEQEDDVAARVDLKVPRVAGGVQLHRLDRLRVGRLVAHDVEHGQAVAAGVARVHPRARGVQVGPAGQERVRVRERADERELSVVVPAVDDRLVEVRDLRVQNLHPRVRREPGRPLVREMVPAGKHAFRHWQRRVRPFGQPAAGADPERPEHARLLARDQDLAIGRDVCLERRRARWHVNRGDRWAERPVRAHVKARVVGGYAAQVADSVERLVGHDQRVAGEPEARGAAPFEGTGEPVTGVSPPPAWMWKTAIVSELELTANSSVRLGFVMTS